MRNGMAKKIALGGILAALAMVILCLGGLIPLATFVCPVICILICSLVLHFCGSRIAWAWYGAVAVLGLLLSPDKEAAAVFLALGAYPILKAWFDRWKASILWKLLYFNGITLFMYYIMIFIFGMDQLLSEYMEWGYIGLGIILLLGNVTFFLVDRLLRILEIKVRSRGR